MDVAIELLRRIPESRVSPGGTYREGEFGYDVSWQSMAKADAWHVPVTVVSRYASMDDIREYVSGKFPDMDRSCWSMTRDRRGGARISWGCGRSADLSPEEMSALERDHADARLVTDTYRCWCFDCDRDEWPAMFGYGPVRVDRKAVRVLQETALDALGRLDGAGLADVLDSLDCPAVCGGKLLRGCLAAYALARRTRTAAFVYKT